MKKALFITCLVFLLCLPSAQAQEKEEEFAGEFFGTPVPLSNYYFVKGVLTIFGNNWGPQPKTPQEWEDCIWDELLLSYEAFRRNIIISDDEAGQEISKILKQDNVAFGWKTDTDAYEKWAKDKTGGTPETFGNQIKHLLQLQKLRKEVMDNISVSVLDSEAYQEFLNEYNTLSTELVQFDEQKDAEQFYSMAKANPDFWEEEKSKRPNDFKRPGFVSLEFLMDLWGFQKEAAYKMMQMEIGDIHPAAPIYKGYGVFKVLEKRLADESKYVQQKEAYYNQISQKKKYEGLKAWIKNLKSQANIKIYKREVG